MVCRLLLSTLAVAIVMSSYDATHFNPDPVRPGRWIFPTVGEIWPKPQMQKQDHKAIFSIHPDQFQFKLQHSEHLDSCEIIVKGVQRIKKRMFALATKEVENVQHGSNPSSQDDHLMNNILYSGAMDSVELKLLTNPGNCAEIYPNTDMNENYEIKVDSPDTPGRAMIVAVTPWGLLRGMESFSHLVYTTADSKDPAMTFFINSTTVNDFPRFSFRGFMLDTSRHFLPKPTILETLDLMEMNKLNALHWHLTDSPSFPYQSATFPELSGKGAFSQRHVYTQNDVADIIEEARIRGIRVIPEFDTPGHTQSWGLGHPELLTECATASADDLLWDVRRALPKFGPVDPIKDTTYQFMKKFFEEVSQVFPDKWLHLGGDEVDKSCWMSNQRIVSFMKANNWTNYNKLESVYIEKLIKIVGQFRVTPLVWQEVFDDGDNITNDTIIHIWKGNWQEEAKRVTRSGFSTVISAPYYLNIISYGTDWPKYYEVDIAEFDENEKSQHLVKGGEVCMWGEFINAFNLIPTSWPRASAVAERLWSSQSTNDVMSAAPRLEEHACRMQARGHMVQPANGPGFCI